MKSKLLLTLLAFIPFSLCGCGNGFGEYTYSNADQYEEYKEPVTINNGELSSLTINWVSGNVSVVQKDEPLSFKEKVTKGGYLPLYYRQFENALEIEYIKSGTKNNEYSSMSKDLEIVIPLSWKDIHINTVSADSALNLKNINKLDVDTVSGKCSGEINQLKITDVDTVSGNLDLTVADTSTLESISIDSVSGNATLFLDTSRGYQLNFNSVSGDAKKNFEKADSNPYSISFDSISGNLTINAKQ